MSLTASNHYWRFESSFAQHEELGTPWIVRFDPPSSIQISCLQSCAFRTARRGPKLSNAVIQLCLAAWSGTAIVWWQPQARGVVRRGFPVPCVVGFDPETTGIVLHGYRPLMASSIIRLTLFHGLASQTFLPGQGYIVVAHHFYKDLDAHWVKLIISSKISLSTSEATRLLTLYNIALSLTAGLPLAEWAHHLNCVKRREGWIVLVENMAKAFWMLMVIHLAREPEEDNIIAARARRILVFCFKSSVNDELRDRSFIWKTGRRDACIDAICWEMKLAFIPWF